MFNMELSKTKQKPFWFVVFANFHGENTPTMASSKLQCALTELELEIRDTHIQYLCHIGTLDTKNLKSTDIVK